LVNEIYIIPVWDTIKTAWEKVAGAKRTFWGAYILIVAIIFVPTFIAIMLKDSSPALSTVIRRVFEVDIALKLVMLIVLYIFMILPGALLCAAGVTILTSMPTISPAIPFLLGIIGGVLVFYLSIRMCISSEFILDKAIQPFDAIKMSFKATRHNFWNCLGILILLLLIFIISLLPLGIGLIWTLPMAAICRGLIYKRLSANC
jgi:hypothetical protein